MKYLTDINPYIFREYDVRGVYPDTINEDVSYTIGVGFGSYIQTMGKKKCLVAYDNRYSSTSLEEAVVKGIIETGCDVVRLGLSTTPMYYYASMKLEIEPGIMITASHNPKDDNGFKIAFDKSGNAKGQEIKDFLTFIQKGEKKVGNGSTTFVDIKEEYIDFLVKHTHLGSKRLKVVIDCGNGTTSILAKELYSKFPIDLTVLYQESDPSFPNHHPDPSIEENLTDLAKKVKELNADVGLGFDGDGDRLGLVDEKGKFIPMDIYMILMIREMIGKVENKTFLYDVKCSKALEDEILRLKGIPYCYRTGNSYTKSKVLEEDMPFGGELSGHVYFNDRFRGFDSGLYAGLRLLEVLSNNDKSLSELLSDVPKYYSTAELKFTSRDETKHQVVEKIKEYTKEKGYKTLQIDGVKVLFQEGWALIRVSNTGPNITARFEAKTMERLEQLKDEFTSLIEKFNKEFI